MNSRKTSAVTPAAPLSRNLHFGGIGTSPDFYRPSSRTPFPAVYFTPDDGANASVGNNAGEAAPKGEGDDANNQAIETAVQKAVKSVLDSSRVKGDTQKALETLAGQVHTLTQRAEAAERNAGKIPADVQTKLDAYTALGEPDAIKARLENETVLVAKDAEATKRKDLDATVKLTGYDPAAVALLAGALDLSYIVEKEEKDGKPVEVPYIQDGDKKRPAGEVLVEKFGKPLLDRMKLEQNTTGTLLSDALAGNQADPTATAAQARASQDALYGSSSF